MRPALTLAILLGLLAGCTSQKCTTDEECDDGLFCNGASSCLLGRCTVPMPPSCDDGLACTVDLCNESLRACNHSAPDVDRDGFGDAKCLDMAGVSLGNDCDDTDRNRFPGNAEVCDTHDEDCDAVTLGGRDGDHDGFVAAVCTNPLPDGGVNAGTDCDDANQGVHAGQLERCNGMDDNCNGQIDEGVKVTRYPDLDHDGFGTGAGALGCFEDPNTSAVGADCDDTSAVMIPGQFKCAAAQGQGISSCASGSFIAGVCPAQGTCHPQPSGLGICL